MTASLAILATLAVAWLLHYTRSVMIPLVLSVFIVTMVAPILDHLVLVRRFPRPIAIAMALLVVVTVGSVMLLMAIDSTMKIVDEAKPHGVKVQEFLQNYNSSEPDSDDEADVVPPAANAFVEQDDEPTTTAAAADEAGPRDDSPNEETASDGDAEGDGGDEDVAESDIDEKDAAGEPGEKTKPEKTLSLTDWVDDVMRRFVETFANQLPGLFGRYAAKTFGTVFGLLVNAFFVVIFVLFLLVGRDSTKVRGGIYEEIDKQVRVYIGKKVLLSAVTGGLVWLSLKLLGLPLASVFGMLAFLLNFIPSVGSVIATLLPIPMAFIQWYHPESVGFVAHPATPADILELHHLSVDSGVVHSPMLILLVVLIPGVMQNAIGNVIEPKIMGDELKLHPITILLALSFWGFIWGPVGMLLATPMTAAIRIVLLRFETGRPVAELLAGKLPWIKEAVGGGGAG